MRLRDLAGLIVIDFIDMDEGRNNRTVERRLKEALKHDRARIQVGRISHFGLLEMSRQRIRTSVLESSTEKCPICGGSGHVRSVSSVALQLLRAIEEMLNKGATHNLIVRTRAEVALYVLNHKRAHLRALEERFRVTLTVSADRDRDRPAILRRRSRRAGAHGGSREKHCRRAAGAAPDDRGRRFHCRRGRGRRRRGARARAAHKKLSRLRKRRTRKRHVAMANAKAVHGAGGGAVAAAEAAVANRAKARQRSRMTLFRSMRSRTKTMTRAHPKKKASARRSPVRKAASPAKANATAYAAGADAAAAAADATVHTMARRPSGPPKMVRNRNCNMPSRTWIVRRVTTLPRPRPMLRRSSSVRHRRQWSLRQLLQTRRSRRAGARRSASPRPLPASERQCRPRPPRHRLR